MTDGTGKGSFGAAGLPVAVRYVHPRNRNRVVWIGAALGALAAGVLLLNIGFGTGNLVANGPLSSAHAMLDDRCAACHTSFEGVGDEKCAACHEKFGDPLGTYTFNAHYVHASGDWTRAFGRENEVSCAACHVEHGGRRADLLATDLDARCARCHGIGGFHDDHPEFEFVAAAVPDDGGLTFPHVRHVDLVLDDRDTDNVEAACLACHVPAADARGFQPISFDVACRDCHLTPGGESAELPIQPPGTSIVSAADDGLSLTLGVETLETVRARGGPGEQWAHRMSAAQFDVDDGVVVKTGIVHADPWVLHNLRRLRQAIHPRAGLADLLVASADVAPADERELYDEALATLRTYAGGLRGRDEDWVQAALFEFDRVAGALERRVADRNTALNDARFRLSAGDARLTGTQVDAIERFAAEVAQPCTPCHAIERATIRRVRQEQQVLRRARFDHGAHVIQRSCLDCHDRIPFSEQLGAGGAIDPVFDHAAIQNVPAIATCRECHRPAAVADGCLTCHEFHPGRDARSRLLP